MPVSRQIGFFRRRSRHAAMIEILQDAVRDVVPFLILGFGLQLVVDVVQGLRGRVQILRSHWLTFESVSAVIACALSTCSLRHLRHVLFVLGLHHFVSACGTLTVSVFVRLWHDRCSVVEQRVRVRANEHGESWTCAALPRSLPFADHAAETVTASCDAKAKFLRNAATHKQRTGDHEPVFREISSASLTYLNFCPQFLLQSARLQGHKALWCFLVDVVLHSTENVLQIVEVLVLELPSVGFQCGNRLC